MRKIQVSCESMVPVGLALLLAAFVASCMDTDSSSEVSSAASNTAANVLQDSVATPQPIIPPDPEEDHIAKLTVTGPSTLFTGNCSPSAVIVKAFDADNQLRELKADVPISVSLSGGRIFVDAACSTPPVTQITMPRGQSDVSFYVSHNLPETISLTAATTRVTSAAIPMTVTTQLKRIDHFSGINASNGYKDGIGSEARFNAPSSITSDGTDFYVVDTNNSTIRKINGSTGNVTTLAGRVQQIGNANGIGSAASFYKPFGIVYQGGFLYVTSLDLIRKVNPSTGQVTTFAGSGAGTYVDGIGTAASFNLLGGITAIGNILYVLDSGNHSVRRVDTTTGQVSSFAGGNATSHSAGSADGVGNVAQFNNPTQITTDGTYLYVGDANSNLRRVDSTGKVESLTINDSSNSPITSWIHGIAVLGSDLYFNRFNTIRKVPLGPLVGNSTWVAGIEHDSTSADGGVSTATFHNSPKGMTSLGTSLYLVDSLNNAVRKIDLAAGMVATLAGMGPSGGMPASALSIDGAPKIARYNSIWGGATDGLNLFVADSSSYSIRKISIASGVSTTLAGKSGVQGMASGIGSAARFYFPSGIVRVGTNLYVLDYDTNIPSASLRKVDLTTAAVTTFMPTINGSSITTDGTSFYLADSQMHVIRKVDIASKQTSVLAGVIGSTGSSDSGVGRFNTPRGITMVGTDLYVADSENYIVRKIATANGQVVVSTLAGAPNPGVVPDYEDGVGTDAKIFTPYDIAADADGKNLYLIDRSGTLRKIEISTKTVTTFAGKVVLPSNTRIKGDTDGLLSDPASLYDPQGLVIAPSGIFLLSEHGIRWIH